MLFLQKELIREVEMGPFKHTVDDGLDIRKVCNLCMSSEYVMLTAEVFRHGIQISWHSLQQRHTGCGKKVSPQDFFAMACLAFLYNILLIC